MSSRVAWLNRSARSEGVYIGLATLIVIGGYVDAWAHRHLASSLETFFTPWHGLLYGAALATGAWLGLEILAARRTIGSWRVAIPTGYELAVVGFALAAVGGVADLAWHSMFGIEVSVDALLSPTHLLLAAGFLLVVTAPARAWLVRPDRDGAVPPAAVLAVALGVAELAFFTQFLNPFADYWPTYDPEPGLTIGIASILVQSAILGAGIVALRALGPIRPGAISLVVVGPAVAAAGAGDTWLTVPAAIAGALVGELLVSARGRDLAPGRLATLIGLVLAVLWASYEGILWAAFGLTWTAHAITGGVILGAVTGWLIGFLASLGAAGVVPPAPARSEPLTSRMAR
jgi:hypothetical protein